MEAVLAIILIFGGGGLVGIAFSPIGQAIADRLRGPKAAQEREDIAGLKDAVAALQEQVSELAERQDFSERVLAQARERGALKPGQGPPA